ncbi:MAG: GNAT family N-acetyltransferase [Rhodococcus sp.]|nr:GNAT family N-acetyltransferase [Rhodococcus sp. (in: high G+C Gram-positive bacteria)]
MTVQIDTAGIWDSEAIADVAAATFPLACPPDASQDDIAAFIDDVLSAEHFAEYLTDPRHTILKVTENGAIVGYAMIVDDEPADPAVAQFITARPTTEINKLYVVPDRHGSGIAAELMETIIDRAHAAGRASLWLGVNQKNMRAQRFYVKHGFTQAGTRSFVVGSRRHDDFVMQRAL